jgi:exodeoxyribonuclease V gamma subunit
MLMGFATGNPSDTLDVPPPFADIDAYGEVGGLEAGSIGALADLAEIVRRWREDSASDADPVAWARRLRALVAALFAPADDADRQTMAALEDALRHWLEQCALAGFEGPIPLSVAGQVWLDALERPSLGRRFRGGGITFCTLTPMRAIPFEVVCLLGMNDGDFPRRSPSSDFDLIGQPGQRRPGDRARRDDDRQLMLEALLSARRVFYLSWCGRSARDNSEQPPSVLLAQLRDYLAQGWSESVVAERTTEHPLQAFSRRYFVGDPRLITMASEWRAAHTRDDAPGVDLLQAAHDGGPDRAPEWASEVTRAVNPELGRSRLRLPVVDTAVPLTIARLAHFLRNPVKAFFRHRLQVIFDEGLQALPDSEAFQIDALERYGLIDELSGSLLELLVAQAPSALLEPDLQSLLDPMIARLERSGSLPMGGPGVRMREALRQQVEPMVTAWCSEREQHPVELERVALRFEHEGMVIEDWLDQRRASCVEADSGLWLGLTASGLRQNAKSKSKARVDKLIEAWIRSLLAAASGVNDRGLLIGKDLRVSFGPVDGELARASLADLLICWRDGQMEPLPVAPRTALAFIEAKEDPDEKAALAYEGDDYNAYGESEEPCLARCFPDYAALTACGRFPVLAERMYGPLNDWAKTLKLTPLGADAATEDES